MNNNPIAWSTDIEFDEQTRIIHSSEKRKDRFPEYNVPLYVTPFEWRNMTDQEIGDVIDDVLEGGGWLDVARALETKLREINS